MWRRLTILLLLTAGCSDAPQAPLADDHAPPGVLRGVVVDPAIVPIEGAAVVAMPGGHNTTTDAEGSFTFEGLEPGTYTLTASKAGYLEKVIVAAVIEDEATPVVKVILPVDSEALAYFSNYYFRGFVECAAWPFNWCAQVNIASIILCEGYGACVGNVTNDRSLALHWLDGVPDFLQTEMVWDASNSMGENFLFVIGGGTREEIASGFVSALNRTRGPSPLMMRLDNQTLEEHSIGGERALMTQLHPSPQQELPACVYYDPCGPSFHLMQDYEYFTHTFYGFQPAFDWQFSKDGDPPLPP